MIKALLARIHQGYRTGKFPDAPPVLPENFHGRPQIFPEKLSDAAISGCPVKALSKEKGIDLGRCIFCGACAEICPEAVDFNTKEYRMGAFSPEALQIPGKEPWQESANPELRKLCGKSLKIRQVSAGGCAACELDFNVLNTLAWDIGRFGIQVVASPRHADALLVTGPVSDNMRLALEKCYASLPEPAFVIAGGACAISGGLYADGTTNGGIGDIIPVDMYVPGCPPHPAVMLEALLRLISKR